MILNPELRRNLWLELTPHRLIAMPAILIAIFVLAVAINEPGSYGALRTAALYGFYGIVYLWGTRRAAASLGDEVRGRTWDGQRMSALDAWTMTWGKLLGGTIFVWYGGLICLAAFMFADLSNMHSAMPLRQATDLVLTGILGQVVAFASALVFLRKMRMTTQISVTLCQFFGLLAIGMSDIVTYLDWVRTHQVTDVVEWYVWSIPTADFRLISLGLFVFWAVTGAYRLMRGELQHRSVPWAWVGFSIFLMAYCAGFLYLHPDGNLPSNVAFRVLLPCFVVAIGLSYGAVFIETKDLVVQRALLRALQASDWSRAGVLMPLWLPSLAIMLVVGVLLTTQTPDSLVPASIVHYFDELPVNLPHMILAGMFFVLRDVGIVLFLNLRPNRRRSDLAAFVYLLLLYIVFAGLIGSLGWDWALPMFIPTPKASALWTIGPVVVEVLIVYAALIWRWRRHSVTIAAAS